MRTVLVTGGSGAIGAAICEELSKDSDVIFTYNNASEKATELALKLRCTAVKCDISDPEDVERLRESVYRSYPKVDVVVNNAGISQIKLFTDTTDEDWQRMMAVNLNGAFYVTKAFLPKMIFAKSGSIINVSSVWGVHGASCEVAYSAAKAGLIGFTKALAKEVGPSGISVNCIAPGVIDTPMNGHLTDEDKNELVEVTPLGKLGKPYDVAQAVRLFADSGFITGQVLGVDGGFY